MTKILILQLSFVAFLLPAAVVDAAIPQGVHLRAGPDGARGTQMQLLRQHVSGGGDEHAQQFGQKVGAAGTVALEPVVQLLIGMALTAHKTVAMFMRYAHTEDDPVRKAAELVANRRQAINRQRTKVAPA